MEKELLEAVALAQRNYWRDLARKERSGMSQAGPDRDSRIPDVATFTARDWADFWSLYVAPDKS
jgi:hypothetical protein